MSESNTALMNRPNSIIGVNKRELDAVAELIFKSKVFGDIQNQEAAAIKIIAGLEKGFTPFQSMAMFDFIQGRPTLNAHGKATLINSSGDFRLKINELTATNCSISVVRKSDGGEWKVISTRTFSIEDAKDAELTTGNNKHSWKKYPRNMLFARCVSNIWRWDTAELNVRKLDPGQIQEFEAEELALDGEVENGNGNGSAVIDGEIVDVQTGEVLAESQDNADAEAVDAEYDAKRKETVDSILALLDVKIGSPEDVETYLDGRKLEMMHYDDLVKMQGDLAAL